MGKKLIWIMVGLLVLIGGVFAFNSAKKSSSTQNDMSKMEQKSSTQNNMMPQLNNAPTVSELMAKNEPYTCSWEQSMNGSSVAYKTFINGQNIRTESVVKNQYSGPITSTFLLKDGYIYSWTSTTSNTGTKVKEMAPGSNTGNPTIESSMTMSFHTLIDSMNRAPGYHCDKGFEASLLDVPLNIKFMSLSK